MAFWQLIAICLVVILCAYVVAVFPILEISSVQWWMVVGLVGMGGMLRFRGCIVVGCRGGI